MPLDYSVFTSLCFCLLPYISRTGGLISIILFTGHRFNYGDCLKNFEFLCLTFPARL